MFKFFFEPNDFELSESKIVDVIFLKFQKAKQQNAKHVNKSSLLWSVVTLMLRTVNR